jgi:hypothetical protein
MEIGMNIFYLSNSAKEASHMHCDKHVVKMIVESAQLLSTAHRVIDGTQQVVLSESGRRVKRWVVDDWRENVLYKATHHNHPSAVWCRQTVEQYNFLHELLVSLCKEYTHRYKKVHKVEATKFVDMLSQLPNNLTARGWIEPPPAMPDYCKVPGNAVQSYRNYYINEKKKFAKWTNRNVPQWFQ